MSNTGAVSDIAILFITTFVIKIIMDKIISSITNILNIDDEILTKFLGYLHPMTVPKKQY